VTPPHRTEGGAGGGSQLPESIRTDVAAFERAVIQLREVVYSHHVTGNYDYLLQVEVADLPAARDVTIRRVVSEPLSDYLRWEHACTAVNIEAGRTFADCPVPRPLT